MYIRFAQFQLSHTMLEISLPPLRNWLKLTKCDRQTDLCGFLTQPLQWFDRQHFPLHGPSFIENRQNSNTNKTQIYFQSGWDPLCHFSHRCQMGTLFSSWASSDVVDEIGRMLVGQLWGFRQFLIRQWCGLPVVATISPYPVLLHACPKPIDS